MGFKTKAQEAQAFNEWGLTNNPQYREAALAYRAAALADGWTEKARNPGQKTEPESLQKDGFTMTVIARDEGENHQGHYRFQAMVRIWGPDHLAVAAPDTYDWPAIQARTRRCNYCGKENVETMRISFAGRACAPCHAHLQPTMERPGWCD